MPASEYIWQYPFKTETMTKDALQALKHELSIKAKNGINFIAAASIVWLIVAYVWTLSYSAYDKSILTFIVGGVMLPLAWLFSKIMKTAWTVKGNALEPLGLWLNFAQLFYFPFLVFVLIKMPEHFVMTYAIITGAHFFPYAWFYDEKAYAVMAGVVSIGAMLIGLSVKASSIWIIPASLSGALAVLAVWLYFSYKRRAFKTL